MNDSPNKPASASHDRPLESTARVQRELNLEQLQGAAASGQSGAAFTSQCFCCGKWFQMGPHAYRGKHVARYGIDVCQTCYAFNWDGWAPHHEMKLHGHLKGNGLPVPERNEKGWLPRD